jgi:hypothetical protein
MKRSLLLLPLLFLIVGCYTPAKYIRVNSPFLFESAPHGDRFEKRSVEQRIQISGVPKDPADLVDTLTGYDSLVIDTLFKNSLDDTVNLDHPVDLNSVTLEYDPSLALSYSVGYHFNEYIGMGALCALDFYSNNQGYSADKSIKRVDGVLGYWFTLGGPIGKSKRVSIEYRNGHFVAGASRFVRQFYSPGEMSVDSIFHVTDTLDRDNRVLLTENAIACQVRPTDKLGIYGGVSFSLLLVGSLYGEEGEEGAQMGYLYGGCSYYLDRGIVSLQGAYMYDRPVISLSYTFIHRTKGRGGERE